MKRYMTAIIEKEGTGYVSLCSELDIASQGDTVSEAKKNSRKLWNYFLSVHHQKELKADCMVKYL